ncbi:hypothetical protein [Runella sp. SP2]|uniref:hypothetical protein n=1 Tax=Runella sp. SP2 TaxID=2268026 RepID=UPI000F07F075|nr:hypothetical protein [Runella sp. SP2]AYQ34360.1 hypothetical protein DTQ70_20325 [Runella sp. SP2]
MKQNKKQTNQYDKIFKENIEAVIPSLMKNVLGILAVSTEELPDDVQHTKERKPDVLKKVVDSEGNSFVLQIEFQVADEPEMVYRMLEYKAMLLRKYKEPVEQFVVFLGKGTPQMVTNLQTKGLNFEYNLRFLKMIDYQLFLKSSKPEEIVFAVLSNFGADNPKNAIEKIISRLEETAETDLSLKKYINQLRILAELRKLDLKIDEIMESIAKYLNEENDYFVVKAKRKFVENLLQKLNLTLEQIADLAGVSVDFVQSVKQKLSDKK